MINGVSCVILSMFITTNGAFYLNAPREKNIVIKDNATILMEELERKKTCNEEIKRRVNKRFEEIERLREEKKRKNFILTYYTSLDEENGGYGGINHLGKKLSRGMVANNYYEVGTRILLDDGSEYIVADRGGKNFNSEHRLDVFVERQYGESDYEYKKRVNNKGVKEIGGKIDE